MGSTRMQVAIISTYFDYDDYDNPVKTYLGAMDLISLTPNLTQSLEVRVQENEGSTDDHLFFNIGFETVKFYNANTKIPRTENLQVNNDNIATIYFNLDRTSNSYERVVFTFIDMFGFLGGLFDFIFFLGLFFVGYVSDKMYHNSVFANLYQVKCQNANKIERDEQSNNKHDPL